jgi:hypothetical protein
MTETTNVHAIDDFEHMKQNFKKIFITALILIAAAIAPNLFVIAQAGYANLSDLALEYLLPSILVLLVAYLLTSLFNLNGLKRSIRNGAISGLLATAGLEVVRESGFRLGTMPGELPQLMGVLLLDRFAQGPNLLSNIAGWSYHFWNGAAFGIIYGILIGKGRVWFGTIFGFLIGIGFMTSPVVIALGVGRFGTEFGWGFPITVTAAHLAFGTILGWFNHRDNASGTGILPALRSIFDSMQENRT